MEVLHSFNPKTWEVQQGTEGVQGQSKLLGEPNDTDDIYAIHFKFHKRKAPSTWV